MLGVRKTWGLRDGETEGRRDEEKKREIIILINPATCNTNK
jgi:hypothetical protein